MSHIRQQIREAIVTKLKEIETFGGRVYPYRTRPHHTLPDALVYTSEDEVNHELDTMKKDKYIRTVTVKIEIRVKATANIDDTIDDLCVETEEKMFDDPAFGGLVKQLDLITTTIELSGESDKTVGLATIEYEAWYRMLRTDAETVIQ